MITIHHVKEVGVKADLHLYCGRKGTCKRTDLIDAMLGNPFVMRDESMRDKVCDAYRETMLSNPQHPHWPRIRRVGLRHHEGQHVALFCFCAPQRCHCDEIRNLALIHADALSAGLA